MKVNRSRLEWYLKNIRCHHKDLSDANLINELANWIETNPECIDMDGVSNPGRYYYSTVGYGVMSLLGERYRMGRVEIFDKQNESGYSIDEGRKLIDDELAKVYNIIDIMNKLNN